MAAIEPCTSTNMHHVELKSRFLRSLLRNQVPDDKRPFRDPSGLSRIIYMVQTHQLLSESFTETTAEDKHTKRWKSAVDEWVERLLTLVSSDSPDKCRVGICLLGWTSRECSSSRFFTSYELWFKSLLFHLQRPADSQSVKIVTCKALGDLITRLGISPTARKDDDKIIQPVLNLLKEDSSEAVSEAAFTLLYTILTKFPSAIQRHYDTVEGAIASKILRRKWSVIMQKKLACCLALLPKSRGNKESWFLMMQKILLLINGHLSKVFQGLEEETRHRDAINLLVLPGKDPPPALGGPNMSGDGSPSTKYDEVLIISSISTLMHSCCEMLTSSYPTQVDIPIHSLLFLVERMLMVDGSLPDNMLLFVPAMQQEITCAELPVLHLSSLELLTAILKGISSQLLPQAASIGKLLNEYFRKCVEPVLRIKLYSITEILLRSMGVGMAIFLAQDVIKNAFADLSPVGHMRNESFSHSSRKRKQSHIKSIETQHVEVKASESISITAISLKISALKAVKALLTEGGAFKSESWRSEVDNLLINIATSTCKRGGADLELAALQALLASLLSPSPCRPPYLAQALDLFRRGKQRIGTDVSEFCAHALLNLEVLIHPRVLPLNDNTINHRSPDIIENGCLSYMQTKGTNHSDSDDDNIYSEWLANGNEAEPALNNQDEDVDMTYADETAREVERADVLLRSNLKETVLDQKTDIVGGATGEPEHARITSDNNQSYSELAMVSSEAIVMTDKGNSVTGDNNIGNESDTTTYTAALAVVEESANPLKLGSDLDDGHGDEMPAIILTDPDSD